KVLKPAATIVLSFAVVIAIGSFLLMLPISSSSGNFTNPLTAIFTATSATCVTGLVVVDTGTFWSVFGQIIILLMIQIGGLGFVTLVSFFNFLIRKKMELRSIQVASESVNTSGFYDVKTLVKYVISISFICEFSGALLLMTTFVPKYGVYGIYISLFIAISAFCNAGFDIMGAVETPYCSLTTLSSDPVVMTVVPLLIIAGGLGFWVWMDIITYRRRKRLSLQSKIVLLFTLILIITGTILTMITEWSNPLTIGNMNIGNKIVNSLFHSVSLRTAGFNTVDLASMHSITKLISLFFMFIGVAPGSTGGGIKITTFAIIIMTVVSVIKNKNDTIIMGRKIDKESVYKALSIIILAALVTSTTAVILFYNNTGVTGIDAAFEAVSAIATTGLSVGVSGISGIISRIILSVTMFIGRVGPVSFAISLSTNRDNIIKNEVYPEGKMMVG
ncbi:MAG: TrkH family potassium uptake protein, partial [Oscillospiraceae bacterium]